MRGLDWPQKSVAGKIGQQVSINYFQIDGVMFAFFAISPFASLMQDSPCEVFDKYRSPKLAEGYSFKLFRSEEESIQCESKEAKESRSQRGPYRKYTQKEREAMVHRIINGESIKSISEKMNIPKRNLIRWKHEIRDSRRKRESTNSIPLESDRQLQGSETASDRAIEPCRETITELMECESIRDENVQISCQ